MPLEKISQQQSLHNIILSHPTTQLIKHHLHPQDAELQ